MDGYAYLEDYCHHPWGNRAVEWDWLRFLWRLDTEEGLSTADIFDIYDLAGPDTWNATDGGDPADMPTQRMRDAATLLLLGGAWNNQDDINGVHH